MKPNIPSHWQEAGGDTGKGVPAGVPYVQELDYGNYFVSTEGARPDGQVGDRDWWPTRTTWTESPVDPYTGRDESESEMTDTAPQLPDTSTWRKIEPGETIPAGTPYMVSNENSHFIVKGRDWDTEVSHYEATTYYADLPAPGPDLSLIPEGFPNAKLLRINGVVGTWYRHTLDRHVVLVTPAAMSGSGLKPCQVKSVEPVTILGDDEVAVPRAEWEDRSSTRSRAYAWGALRLPASPSRSPAESARHGWR